MQQAMFSVLSTGFENDSIFPARRKVPKHETESTFSECLQQSRSAPFFIRFKQFSQIKMTTLSFTNMQCARPTNRSSGVLAQDKVAYQAMPYSALNYNSGCKFTSIIAISCKVNFPQLRWFVHMGY